MPRESKGTKHQTGATAGANKGPGHATLIGLIPFQPTSPAFPAHRVFWRMDQALVGASPDNVGRDGKAKSGERGKLPRLPTCALDGIPPGWLNFLPVDRRQGEMRSPDTTLPEQGMAQRGNQGGQLSFHPFSPGRGETR